MSDSLREIVETVNRSADRSLDPQNPVGSWLSASDGPDRSAVDTDSGNPQRPDELPAMD